MKFVRLTVIADGQSKKAEKLAERIQETLAVACVPEINPYYKFENSYCLSFRFPLMSPDNSIAESIEKASQLCSPWSVYFDNERHEVELIFNQDENVRFGNVALNVIMWAQWQIEDAPPPPEAEATG